MMYLEPGIVFSAGPKGLTSLVLGFGVATVMCCVLSVLRCACILLFMVVVKVCVASCSCHVIC